MEESRKVYGWLVRGGNAAVGCSSMWADTMRGEYYCGNLLWQSSLTPLFQLLNDVVELEQTYGLRAYTPCSKGEICRVSLNTN